MASKMDENMLAEDLAIPAHTRRSANPSAQTKSLGATQPKPLLDHTFIRMGLGGERGGRGGAPSFNVQDGSSSPSVPFAG